MLAMMGAALVLSAGTVNVAAPVTPAEAASHRAGRILAAGSADGWHGSRADLTVAFETAQAVAGGDRHHRMASDDYRGLAVAEPAQARRDSYARTGRGAGHGDFRGFGAASGLGGGGLGGGGFGGGLTAAAPTAGFVLPEADTLVAEAGKPSEALASNVVEAMAGGPAAAKALRPGAPMAKDGDAVVTPLPPSVLLFATGLVALHVSRRKTG